MRKIVALNGNAVGDVLLSTPILKGLRELYPDSHLTFLVRPECRKLVEGLPFLDDVVTYQKGDSIWPAVRTLWKYDLALCLDFKYRSAVIPFLARIPIRAGMRHKRGLFLTHPVERDPQEADIYEPDKIAGAIDVVGRTTLLEMSELVRLADLFIGPCSGPLHIAAAVGTPVVTLYSSTSPRQWAPKNNTAVIFRQEDCCPCDRRPYVCTEFPCIDSITVDEAYAACKEILGKNGKLPVTAEG